MTNVQDKELNIVKEVRRAKRKKKWILSGNCIPLSTSEKKAISNKAYRDKIVLSKKEKKSINFQIDYKNDLYNFLDNLNFTHKGSFTYRDEISMYKCYRDGLYIFGALLKRGVIDNYLILVEFEPNHVHLHFLLSSNSKTKNINNSIYKIFNGKYEKGNLWIEPLKDEKDRKAQIEYFIEKINVTSEKNIRQLESDYWYYDVA